MAIYEVKKGASGYFCPMMDARRMEVYCTIYNEREEEILHVQAMVIDEGSLKSYSDKPFYMFGDGALKCKEVLKDVNFIYIENSLPSATKLLPIAIEKFNQGLFEDIAYFEPFYLKEFIAGKKKING
jgi:tRNA threonylcarbamoyladenosine biosynthesis protein TsaB